MLVTRQLYPHLIQLGASPLCDLGLADDSISRTVAGTAETDWTEWRDAVLMPALAHRVAQPHSFQQRADSDRKKRKEQQQRDKEQEEKEAEEGERKAVEEGGAGQNSNSSVLDVEELGAAMTQQARSSTRSVQPVEQSSAVQVRARPNASLPSTTASASPSPLRPMLTDQLRATLSKQGYKLLGTHSGVKLCRWTKAMLRGRGGCYKNTSAPSRIGSDWPHATTSAEESRVA